MSLDPTAMHALVHTHQKHTNKRITVQALWKRSLLSEYVPENDLRLLESPKSPREELMPSDPPPPICVLVHIKTHTKKITVDPH